MLKPLNKHNNEYNSKHDDNHDFDDEEGVEESDDDKELIVTIIHFSNYYNYNNFELEKKYSELQKSKNSINMSHLQYIIIIFNLPNTGFN